MRLGWSRVAWKLFLIDLAVILPVILILIIIFTLAVSPFTLFGLESVTGSVASIVAILLLVTAGMLLFVFLAIIAAVILSITRPVMHQACAVDGLSIRGSIRLGFRLLRICVKKTAITWSVWLAVRLVWMFTIVPAVILLFPILLLTILFRIVSAAVLASLSAGIASLFVSTILAWTIGIIFALPLFIIVAFSSTTFLSGLVEVVKSSFWTLSYREFRPLTSIIPQVVTEVEQVRLGAALV